MHHDAVNYYLFLRQPTMKTRVNLRHTAQPSHYHLALAEEAPSTARTHTSHAALLALRAKSVLAVIAAVT